MELAAKSLHIPPRPWLGFIPVPRGADGAVAPVVPLPIVRREDRNLTGIATRRWLDFVPEPGARRRPWSAVVGAFAIGLPLGAWLLMTGTAAEATEPEIAASEQEVVHASALAEPEQAPGPTPQAEPEPVEAPASAIEQTPAVVAPMDAPAPLVAQPAPKRPTIEPMSPAQLRKAQRVASTLGAAIAEGDVKLSSLSFAVVADSQGTFWSEASSICNELVIDGVIGWRLPSVGELRDLGRARVLPGAAYWSRTRGRDVESAHVYNTRTRRSGTWLASEPTGATVCVQPRPRAPEQD